MYTKIEKIASMVKNNIISGLSGMHTNLSLSDELILDAIINERLAMIKEYLLSGVPLDDLYISINCIPIDCDTNIERCNCNEEDECSTNIPHFLIPLLMQGISSIAYIGSNDRQEPFTFYSSLQLIKYRKYKKRRKNKPYIWIDTTPNKEGMYDGFIFNAPLLKQISITAIFKDPRQLKKYECCIEDDLKSFMDAEIIERVTKKLILYYKLMFTGSYPNTQEYMPG